MPRVPRAPQAEGQRHNPLAEEYAPSYQFKQKASHKKRKSRSDGDNEDDHVIGTKAARKILRIGQELADEDEAQQKRLTSGAAANPAFAFDTRFSGDVEPDDEGDAADGNAETWEDESEGLVELEVARKEKRRLELISG
jgi:essential nuclear protein 1